MDFVMQMQHIDTMSPGEDFSMILNRSEPSRWQLTGTARNVEAFAKGYVNCTLVITNFRNLSSCFFFPQLYERRAKVLKTDKERKYWSEISDLYMTEESEGDDDVVNQHPLTWTSDCK